MARASKAAGGRTGGGRSKGRAAAKAKPAAKPKAKAKRAPARKASDRRPETPKLTADCIVIDPEGRVLLIRRKHAPFEGAYALPGGFVDVGETVEDGCRRELMEETGVKAGKLTLVGVFSDPQRDPRGHTVSVVFATRVRTAKAQAGDDAAEVEWVRDWKKCRMAFDHAKVLRTAMGMV